jgi:phosphate-selective porin OprO/OprP
MPGANLDVRLRGRFGPGFELSTDDDEYQFQFHDLTQVDYRGYFRTANGSVDTDKSSFVIPRQWLIFSGRLSKNFEYYTATNFGLNNLTLLDAFLNIHFDDRLQIKIGRYKTPFTYEFYNEPINGLMNAERSLFFNNFGLNREIGIMPWGQLFDKRFDYAVGIFNSNRNNFVSTNDSVDLAAFVNARPFGAQKGSVLENFNIGGSVDTGNEFNIPVPSTFRTNVATSGANTVGVPFFGFNKGVINNGPRALWALHAAYFYKHLSLIAEWQSGYDSYSIGPGTNNRAKIPVGSYYVQAGYFLTGETVASRGVLKPLKNFDVRPGKFGLGAIELTSRYSTLNYGNQVFTAGLADPNLWTNSAYMIDVGVNWYWSQYIKVYLGWEHAEFGNPVILEPGKWQSTNNLLWARFQIYF